MWIRQLITTVHEYVLPNNETVHALLESKKLLTAEEIPFTCVNVPIPKRPTPYTKESKYLGKPFPLRSHTMFNVVKDHQQHDRLRQPV